ncbi:MAG: hypothetical protein Q4A37_02620 [Candidatus Saccharibacteria bacterium]|nr:hypothetical protein [Candidatus Saccharibacteria bacterium]
MYPNDPFNAQPSGIDYLNQIATPPPASGMNKKTKLLLAIIGVMGVISLILIGIMAMNPKSGASLNHVAARLQKLQHITTTYKPKLKSTATQDINSSLNAILVSANKSIAEPAARSGLDVAKQAKELAALDPPEELVKKLDDALLNANLDVVYTYTINTELADTILLLERVQKATRDSDLQTVLTKIIADLTNIRKQLVTPSQ